MKMLAAILSAALLPLVCGMRGEASITLLPSSLLGLQNSFGFWKGGNAHVTSAIESSSLVSSNRSVQFALCTPSQVQELTAASAESLCSREGNIGCDYVGRLWNQPSTNSSQLAWSLDVTLQSDVELRLISLSCADADVEANYAYHFVNPGGEELSSSAVPLKYIYPVFAALWFAALLFMADDCLRFSRRFEFAPHRPTWGLLCCNVFFAFLAALILGFYYLHMSSTGNSPAALATCAVYAQMSCFLALAPFLLNVGKGLGFSRETLHERERSTINMTLIATSIATVAYLVFPALICLLLMIFMWWAVGRLTYKTSRSSQRFMLILGMTRQRLEREAASIPGQQPVAPAPGPQPSHSSSPHSATIRSASTGASGESGRNGEAAAPDAVATAQTVAGQVAQMRGADAANFGTSPILQLRQARFYWMFGGMSILLIVNELFSLVWNFRGFLYDGQIWSSVAIVQTIQLIVFVRLIQMMRLNGPYDLYYDAQQYNLLLLLAPVVMGPEAQWRNAFGQPQAPLLGSSQPSEPRAAPPTFFQQIAETWRAAGFAPDGDVWALEQQDSAASGSGGLPPGTVAARRRVLVVQPDKSESLGTVAVAVPGCNSGPQDGAPSTSTAQPAVLLEAAQVEDAEAGAVVVNSQAGRNGYHRL